MMILDVKGAFLYGDIEDTVYIELPPRILTMARAM